MIAPLAQQPKSPPGSVRRSARGSTRRQAQVTSVEGAARSETAQAPSTPVGRKRGEERHQALRQHPGQDLASDPVDALVPPSVLLRGGAERSPAPPLSSVGLSLMP